MKMFNAFRVYEINKTHHLVGVEGPFENDVIRRMVVDNFATEECADALHDTIFEMPAVDPSISAWSSWGFSAPSYFEDKLAMHIEGCVFFFAEKRERLLPGEVLRRAVAEEAEALAVKQDAPVNKKQVAEIKDVVLARLLPKSHIKCKKIPMMFTTIGSRAFLYVFTGSVKLAEDALAVLRKANGTLNVQPFDSRVLCPMDYILTDMLFSQSDYPRFNPDSSANLYHKLHGVVTYKDAELDADSNDALAENEQDGFLCRKLRLSYLDPAGAKLITFALDAKGSFTGMKFFDMLEDRVREMEDSGDARVHFQAYALILSRTINEVLWAIRGYLVANEKKAQELGLIEPVREKTLSLGETDLATDFPIAKAESDDDDFEL